VPGTENLKSSDQWHPDPLSSANPRFWLDFPKTGFCGNIA